MTQVEIDEAVAHATGESMAVIHNHGFGIADPFEVDFDPEPRAPLMIDWETMQPAYYIDL